MPGARLSSVRSGVFLLMMGGKREGQGAAPFWSLHFIPAPTCQLQVAYAAHTHLDPGCVCRAATHLSQPCRSPSLSIAGCLRSTRSPSIWTPTKTPSYPCTPLLPAPVLCPAPSFPFAPDLCRLHLSVHCRLPAQHTLTFTLDTSQVRAAFSHIPLWHALQDDVDMVGCLQDTRQSAG